ncbi:hypothetical protein AB9F46_10350 [Rhizobium leguminosarum]
MTNAIYSLLEFIDVLDARRAIDEHLLMVMGWFTSGVSFCGRP